MNNNQSFITQENIALLLSVLSFCGTLGTWVYNFLKSRKRLVIETNGYSNDQHGLLLHMSFVNKSTLPVCINEIAVATTAKEYVCDKISQVVMETTHSVGKTVRSHQEYYSLDFPINLDPLCGKSGYIFFSSDQGNFPQFSNEVNVIIRTNRGRAIRTKLPLQNPLI